MPPPSSGARAPSPRGSTGAPARPPRARACSRSAGPWFRGPSGSRRARSARRAARAPTLRVGRDGDADARARLLADEPHLGLRHARLLLDLDDEPGGRRALEQVENLAGDDAL